MRSVLILAVVSLCAVRVGAQVVDERPSLVGVLSYAATEQPEFVRSVKLELESFRLAAPAAELDGDLLVFAEGSLTLVSSVPGRVSFVDSGGSPDARLLRNFSLSAHGVVLTAEEVVARDRTLTLRHATLRIAPGARLMRRTMVPGALLEDLPTRRQ